VSGALTGPFLVAAALLGVSGAAKLRTPEPATRALTAAGIWASRPLIRAWSLVELAVGLLALAAGGRATAAGLAVLYAGFAGVTVLLARRRAACGCFGESDAPASGLQSGLSAVLATACALAALLAAPQSLSTVLAHSPVTATTLVIGGAGAVYAAVLAYTELPTAWAAWSGR
jgi:hypothetical protein